MDDTIGTHLNEAMLALGISDRYFGEFPYPDHNNQPRLTEGLGFRCAEHRDRVANAFRAALTGSRSKVTLRTEDNFEDQSGYSGFSLELEVHFRRDVNTTDEAYAVMVAVSERIHAYCVGKKAVSPC
jgi:hypothetical protein